VAAGGQKIGELSITNANASFESTFALPAQLVGQSEMVIELEVDHTVQLPGDNRALGIVFGKIGLR